MIPLKWPPVTAFLALFSLAARATDTPIEIKAGMVINRSVIIKKSTYLINNTLPANQALVTIEGSNITVDFNNCIIRGSNDKEWPNEFYGLAIRVKGDHITLKNAFIHGYKVAILASGCKDLVIENCDASYNYRQHLQSNWQREDVSDWMSYHHNEKDEWLRYGAGIYLTDCTQARVRNNRITGGQCALMMVRCNDGIITDNDFSFNSAIGIGMYRSSRNQVINNRLDFNVRGYSDGIYNRGQDSAGILVFEQCNENTFAYNSVTHGGDGFFLWAGQSTMDSGEGGCNDNLLFANDFSYAPTNGIELTFSRNRVSFNQVRECDHGIWGGYSFNTDIINNEFTGNRIAIAIEHGQNNTISFNQFSKNREGIRLWANRKQPPDWIYAQKRDTRSMNYVIDHNSFYDEALAINIKLTEKATGRMNGLTRVGQFTRTDTSASGIAIDSGYEPGFLFPENNARERALLASEFADKKLPGKSDSTLKGRKHIRITEWGPYDYRYPILFLKKIDSNRVAHFDVLGPKGKWKITGSTGFEHISRNEGVFPATITAKMNGPDRLIAMEFRGEAFTDAFGKKQPAQTPFTFSFRNFEPEADWNVSFYAWDSLHNPNKDYAGFKQLFNQPPLKSEQKQKLDYTWWGNIGKGLPADSFATLATATMELKPGKYRLGVTADDLVRVYIDGKPVIDFWDAALYKYDEDAHHSVIIELGGKHDFRIEHVENGGYATLMFYLMPL